MKEENEKNQIRKEKLKEKEDKFEEMRIGKTKLMREGIKMLDYDHR